MKCNICDGKNVGDKKATIKHFFENHPTTIISLLKDKGIIS